MLHMYTSIGVCIMILYGSWNDTKVYNLGMKSMCLWWDLGCYSDLVMIWGEIQIYH